MGSRYRGFAVRFLLFSRGKSAIVEKMRKTNARKRRSVLGLRTARYSPARSNAYYMQIDFGVCVIIYCQFGGEATEPIFVLSFLPSPDYLFRKCGLIFIGRCIITDDRLRHSRRRTASVRETRTRNEKAIAPQIKINKRD